MSHLKSFVLLAVLTANVSLSTNGYHPSSTRLLQENLLLSNPHIVRIDLAPITSKTKVDDPSVEFGENIEPYAKGQKIQIQLVVTNNSLEKLNAPVLDTYYQNRPELWRNGLRVPYREEVEKLILAKDANPEFLRFDNVPLLPNQSTKLEILDLTHWYDPLEPGSYRLMNRHRFGEGGKWTESSMVLFEVKPK